MTHSARGVHLRRGDTSLAVRLDATELPCILHWGPDLGDHAVEHLPDLLRSLEMPTVDGAIYQHSWASVLPQQTSGWVGRPGLLGSRAGRAWALTFDLVDHTVTESTDCTRLTSVALDRAAGLEVTTEIELFGNGLLRLRACVRNLMETPYEVTLLEPSLPVPGEVDELLDMAGRHAHERTPQRHAFTQGQHVREAWGGRPGHDSATMLCRRPARIRLPLGPGVGVHLAWSGNQVLCAERRSGEHPLAEASCSLPGEVVLGHARPIPRRGSTPPGARGSMPSPPASTSTCGRARSPSARATRAPQHLGGGLLRPDLQKLVELAELAAELGVERFVLDDGWFRGRRDDTSSLGDWVVDEDVGRTGSPRWCRPCTSWAWSSACGSSPRW